ncbi:MAG: PP2C family protein-serine/threonine phosphatase [Phycisphaerales bacterium]
MRFTFTHKLMALVAGVALISGVAASAVVYSWAIRAFEDGCRKRLRTEVALAAEDLAQPISACLTGEAAARNEARSALHRALLRRLDRMQSDGLTVSALFVVGTAEPDPAEFALLEHVRGTEGAARKRAPGPVQVRTTNDVPKPAKPSPFVVDALGKPCVQRTDLDAGPAFESGLRLQEPPGSDDGAKPTLLRTSDAPEVLCIAHAFAERGDAVVGYVGVQIGPGNLRSGSEAAFRGVQAGGLVALLVGSGLGFIGSRWLTRPLAHVVAGLRRMGNGDLDTPLEPASDDEVGEMALHANHAMELLREQIELKQSLHLAQQVQRALLPGGPPRFPGLDIASFCVYCDQTGGDYFDFIPVGTGEDAGLALVVGDVTGHGVSAALLMATARAILRSHAPTPDNLGEYMARVNRELCGQEQTGRFMTLFLLLVEPRLAGLRWVSAGHDAALVYDPVHQTFSELNGSDLPLGVEAGWAFTPFHSPNPLGNDQVIVIGTDGIWEMRNKADKLFGKENLKRVIRKNASQTADQIGRELLAALDAHRGEMPAQDDITFIVVKVARA